MAGDILTDFEILEPPKRTARLMGETVDLTIVPARVALKFIDFSKKYGSKKLEETEAEDFEPAMVEDMMDLVAQICQKSNQKITKDWLLDNMDVKSLMKFVQFVFAGITKTEDTDQGTGTGKN